MNDRFSAWQSEFDHVLDRIDRLGITGRSRSAATRQLRQYLRWLHHLLARQNSVELRDISTREALHQLMRRAEMAKTPQDLHDVVRDIRQFQVSASTSARARQLEQRLQELEGQVKTAAEDAADLEGIDEAEVVTVESLKQKRILFAIMPFAREFDDVWIGGIKRAATGTGLTPIRIDMITQSSEITDDIVRVIECAEIVVVDVTGNNPNVMFEFGFALARKKKHAVISQSTESLTFDIKNLRSIMYANTWKGIEALHKDLQGFIKGAIGAKSKPARRKKKATGKKAAIAAT